MLSVWNNSDKQTKLMSVSFDAKDHIAIVKHR